MTKEPQFISEKPISEDTLLEKAVFGFYSHTKRYEESKKRQNVDQVTLFLEDLVSICNEIFKFIKSREYNATRHRWIESAENGDLIPEKFNGISKQLRSGRPTYTTRKSAKFCHNFSAICIVANDLLGGHYVDETPAIKKIRSLAELGGNETISKRQMGALGAIAKELRSYGEQTNPNWAITYEGSRPIIKTDKGKFFLSGMQVRDVAELVAGRYIIYRRTFNDKGIGFVRDYLNIRNHRSGSIFSWYVYNFEMQKTRVFNGVVYYMKNMVCLQGIDDEPYSRMRCAMIPTKEWQAHKSGEVPSDTFFSGELLTSHLYAGDAEAVTGKIVLTAEKRGDLPESEFQNKAKSLEITEIPSEILTILHAPRQS